MLEKILNMLHFIQINHNLHVIDVSCWGHAFDIKYNFWYSQWCCSIPIHLVAKREIEICMKHGRTKINISFLASRKKKNKALLGNNMHKGVVKLNNITTLVTSYECEASQITFVHTGSQPSHPTGVQTSTAWVHESFTETQMLCNLIILGARAVQERDWSNKCIFKKSV